MANTKRVYEYDYSAYLGGRWYIKLLENGEVQGNYYCFDDEPMEDTLSIKVSDAVVQKVRDAMKEFPEFFLLKKGFEPTGMILDGYHELFYADNGEKKNSVSVSNWGFCDPCKELDIIAEFNDKVAEILIGEGIDKKYFYGPDREDDEPEVFELEDAIEKAKGIEPTIDKCEETKDAFIFSWPGLREEMIIGQSAMVVLKNHGEVLYYAEYLSCKHSLGLTEEDGEVIAEHTIK